MEFPRELCQAELAALPSPRGGIRQVGGAARPPRPPPPGAPLPWPDSRSSAKPLRGVHHPRGRGTSRHQRPRPTLPQAPAGGNRGALGGERAKPARRACLFAAIGARGPENAPLPGPGPRRGGRRGGGGALAAALAFCFVLKPAWGRGSTLPMRNFLFARLRSPSFCPALELTRGSRQCGSPRAHPGAPGARGGGGGAPAPRLPGPGSPAERGRRLASRFPGAPASAEPSGD